MCEEWSERIEGTSQQGSTGFSKSFLRDLETPRCVLTTGYPRALSDRIGAGGSRLAEGFAPVSVDRNVHQFWQ